MTDIEYLDDKKWREREKILRRQYREAVLATKRRRIEAKTTATERKAGVSGGQKVVTESALRTAREEVTKARWKIIGRYMAYGVGVLAAVVLLPYGMRMLRAGLTPHIVTANQSKVSPSKG